MSNLISIKGALALFAGLSIAFLGVQFAFAAHNGADVDISKYACGETTFTATVDDPDGSHLVDNMYLVVHADGETESEVIPADGDEAEITVGPFDEDTAVLWRVFGGGERAYDDPLWDGYGDADFTSDITEYADGEDGYDWTVEGPDDDNPFLNWNTVEVEGCEGEAPVVEIDSPRDGATVGGLVDIEGSVEDNVELSHYNLSLYPGNTDLSDGGTHIDERLNDERWCTNPTSGTVELSDDVSGDLCDDWDTTQYEDGDYQIRLAARDAEGNRDNSDPYDGGTSSVHVIDITIDNDSDEGDSDDDDENDSDPDEKDSCKRGGWEDLGFRNQGQCIRFVNTGMDSR